MKLNNVHKAGQEATDKLLPQDPAVLRQVITDSAKDLKLKVAHAKKQKAKK